MKSTVLLASVVALASGACDCEWKASRNECDLSTQVASKALEGSTTPLASILQGMATCNALSNETCSTNADCGWSSKDGQCDVSETRMMQIMMGNIDVTAMTVKALTCAGLSSQGACGGNSDCKWGTECELDEKAVMAALAGPEMGKLLEKETLCGKLSTSTTCDGNSECKWDNGKKKCDVSQATMIKAMGGTAGEALAVKADACTKDKSKSACDSCIEEGTTDMGIHSARQYSLLLGTLVTFQGLVV